MKKQVKVMAPTEHGNSSKSPQGSGSQQIADKEFQRIILRNLMK